VGIVEIRHGGKHRGAICLTLVRMCPADSRWSLGSEFELDPADNGTTDLALAMGSSSNPPLRLASTAPTPL
jgi:hypothetical protein